MPFIVDNDYAKIVFAIMMFTVFYKIVLNYICFSKLCEMSFLDIVLGCLLLFSVYNGLKNGLFVELASLVALIIGIFVAIKFSGIVRDGLQSMVSWSPKTMGILSFGITFLLVVLGIHLLAKVLTGLASFAFLGWLNTLAGAACSVLKTILMLSVVIGLFQKININNLLVKQETLNNSMFYNPIGQVAEFVYPSLEKMFHEGVSTLKKMDDMPKK